MASFEDRLKGYSRPENSKNWHGCSRDQEYLDRWSARASTNSGSYKHRAADGPIDLPSTNVTVRDTAMRPFVKRSAEAVIKAARADLDHVGGTHLPNVRRNTD
jgi:hypothetical protein